MCPFQLGRRLFSLPIPLKQADPKTKVQPGRIRTAVNSARSSRHTKCLQHLTTLLARMQLSKIANRRGGADRDRTDDFQLAKLALSQLRYGPVRSVVGLDRFELSTPRLSSVCSNQLSYRPSPSPGSYGPESPPSKSKIRRSPFGPSEPDSKPTETSRHHASRVISKCGPGVDLSLPEAFPPPVAP